MSRIAFPIWQDIYLELPETVGGSFVRYQIRDDETNKIIFSGRAYKITGKPLKININKHLQTVMYSDINPSLIGQEQVDMEASKNFSVLVNNSVIQDYFTWLDYSYSPYELGATKSLNLPINEVYPVNGVKCDSVVIKNGLLKHTFSHISGSGCGRYQVIYKNLFGGYDTFLFEGNDTKTDSMTDFTYEKAYDNNTLEFEKTTYMRDMSTRITLNSGWLSNEQAERFKHLAESNVVYLYDTKEDKFYPAIITDADYVYKTRENQGKLVNYSLNLTFSQTKIVR